MESFYVVGVSNGSMDLHPTNTLTNFKNELQQGLNVTGYKIALQSLSLDNKYGNIPRGILSTKNHFLLFVYGVQTAGQLSPNAVCNITDSTMSATSFVKYVNRKLGAGVMSTRFRMTATSKGLQITLSKCDLLLHSEINKCFNFPGETFLRGGEKYVLLKSFDVDRIINSRNIFPFEKNYPKLIKVRLEEMCQNLSQVKLSQDLAIIKVEPKKVYPVYNVCKRKEYFNLNCNRLTSLSVQLVDENNRPLQLLSGQPTFVKLQLKKFPMSSQVLRLSSFESTDIFPDNTNSSFRIMLQQPLDCCNWDVALSSIYLPSKTNAATLLTEDNCYVMLPDGGRWKKILLHELKTFTDEGFAAHFTSKVAAAFPSQTPPISITLEGAKLHLTSTVNVKIRLSGMLTYLLDKAISPTEPAFWPIECEKNVKQSLGKLDFKKLHPHVVLLYCNFITPLAVADTFGQVLQMIPYYNSDAAGDSLMKYEAQHLDFIQLAMNDKTTLHFEMRNSSGDLIIFQDPEEEILLTLVFRER